MSKELSEMTFDELVSHCAAMEVEALIQGTGPARKRVYSIVELSARWQYERLQKEGKLKA